MIPPCGVPIVVSSRLPSSTTPAFSQRRITVVNTGTRVVRTLTGLQDEVLMEDACSMVSKHLAMSASSTHWLLPLRASVTWMASIASIGHRPGRKP